MVSTPYVLNTAAQFFVSNAFASGRMRALKNFRMLVVGFHQ